MWTWLYVRVWEAATEYSDTYPERREVPQSHAPCISRSRAGELKGKREELKLKHHVPLRGAYARTSFTLRYLPLFPPDLIPFRPEKHKSMHKTRGWWARKTMQWKLEGMGKARCSGQAAQSLKTKHGLPLAGGRGVQPWCLQREWTRPPPHSPHTKFGSYSKAIRQLNHAWQSYLFLAT